MRKRLKKELANIEILILDKPQPLEDKVRPYRHIEAQTPISGIHELNSCYKYAVFYHQRGDKKLEILFSSNFLQLFLKKNKFSDIQKGQSLYLLKL